MRERKTQGIKCQKKIRTQQKRETFFGMEPRSGLSSVLRELPGVLRFLVLAAFLGVDGRLERPDGLVAFSGCFRLRPVRASSKLMEPHARFWNLEPFKSLFDLTVSRSLVSVLTLCPWSYFGKSESAEMVSRALEKILFKAAASNKGFSPARSPYLSKRSRIISVLK